MTVCRFSAVVFLVFAALFHLSNVTRAESEICKRLKEISSVDPHASPYFRYKTPEERCRQTYWSELKPLPLSKILNEAERKTYDKAIADKKCAAAEELLSKRFVEAHPKVPSIFADKRDYEEWQFFVIGLHFPRLAICRELDIISKALAEIDRLGLKPKPYSGQIETTSPSDKVFPDPVLKMYIAVFNLHLQFGQSLNSDIAVALLELSVEGRAVKFHPDQELYWAYRLHMKGRRDPILQKIIDRPMDPKRKAEIVTKAKRGEFESVPYYPE